MGHAARHAGLLWIHPAVGARVAPDGDLLLAAEFGRIFIGCSGHVCLLWQGVLQVRRDQRGADVALSARHPRAFRRARLCYAHRHGLSDDDGQRYRLVVRVDQCHWLSLLPTLVQEAVARKRADVGGAGHFLPGRWVRAG